RKKYPENAALSLELAQSYKDIFDLGKNVHYLEKALALDKNSKEIKFKYDEAVLQRMLSLNPDDSYGHNALGVLYWSNNEPYKAIQSFMISLDINPYFADAHFNLAMAYKAAGIKKKAVYHLKKALKLKPDMTIARQELDKIK
ncbi:MAG: tetratricopeptide repeat protein, partial [Candidatus Omnitrophota bacterium]|nr:tetratricopeptide repeat protein [Candidatus Omnitrophota bacterium]